MTSPNVETTTPPGRQISIGTIPTAITIDHNEAYYYWQDSGIRNALLFHADAHPDMNRGAPHLGDGLRERLGDGKRYFLTLDIDTFIPPAFHYGIVSSMYWLNPHSQNPLQYMGSNSCDEEERPLRTRLTYRWRGYEHIVFGSRLGLEPPLLDEEANYQGVVKRIGDVRIDEGRPFILDIDLDAFCCTTQDIAGVSRDYRESGKGVENYPERVDSTMDMLASLDGTPALITISRSEGNTIYAPSLADLPFRECCEKGWDEASGRAYIGTASFVDPELIEDVEGITLEGLRKIYG